MFVRIVKMSFHSKHIKKFEEIFESKKEFIKNSEGCKLLQLYQDKTNPEKNFSHEFRNIDIFKASDTMVDSLTQLIAKKREKNDN